MEQVTRKNGSLYYGNYLCRSADDAYCHFRDDYHASLGKQFYKRLNYAMRQERIHGFRVYFSDDVGKALDAEFGEPKNLIQYRLLGLVGISYCRGFSGKDFPDYEDEKFERWFDWFMMHSGKTMRMVGKDAKYGRTAKNRKKRYR